MKTIIKNAENIHSIIPLGARERLEREALRYQVTMSWIVRALIRQYRQRNPNPPRIRRPRVLQGPHVRFCLKLYGEKNELFAWARSGGGEFAPILREVLELWMVGELDPELESTNTVKTVKKFVLVFDGAASAIPIGVFFKKPHDFWPKNPDGNVSIMKLGISNRKSLTLYQSFRKYGFFRSKRVI